MIGLPTPVKSLENMSKHLTRAESEARAGREEITLPARRVKAPGLVKRDPAALKIWKRVVRDMEGLEILDALDADTLGIYCAKLARRDALQEIYLEAQAAYRETGEREPLKRMASLSGSLQGSERELLAYASKLGLTPESRVRLARKLAEPETDEPDGDLFA